MGSRPARRMSGKTGNPGRDPRSIRACDLYETPSEAVHALLKVYALPKNIWEPCAGRGAIARVLRNTGHNVYATDLVRYGTSRLVRSGVNFLAQTKRPAGYNMILTNPPYGWANQFVRHALDLCPRVCMLLRLAFLEGVTRSDILDNAGLAQVFIFRNRLPRMHRAGWDGPQATSTICFAWFCWDADHHGPTQLHRITWEKP